MNNSESVRGGNRRGEKVGHTDGSMPPGSCQCALRAQRDLPVLVVSWQVLVGVTTVGPQLLVLGRPVGTVERLGVQRCCCGDHTAFDQRPQAPGHVGVAHSRRGAGVDEVLRD